MVLAIGNRMCIAEEDKGDTVSAVHFIVKEGQAPKNFILYCLKY